MHGSMYHDDPISQQAPSECFDLHMSPWQDLYWRIQNNAYPARCRYEEYMSQQFDEAVAEATEPDNPITNMEELSF